MSSGLLPDQWHQSIYEIDFDALLKKGIKGIMFDIDNTLVPYSTPQPDDKLIQWLRFLQDKGFKAAILSNANRKRIDLFNQKIDLEVAYSVRKPSIKGYEEITHKMGLKPEEMCMIGDQLYTDILGGNRFGAYTILVTPMVNKEPKFVLFKRLFEKPILRTFKRNMENKNRSL